MSLADLDDNQQFLLRWMFCFGEAPMPKVFWDDVWSIAYPKVAHEAAVRSKEALVAAGLAEETTDEEGSHYLALTDAARAVEDELYAPLRQQPLRDLSLFELGCLIEALDEGGFLEEKARFGDGWAHLVEDPFKELNDLVGQDLLLEYVGDTWHIGCTPTSWAHREEIRERFAAVQPELREGLHQHFIRGLELEADAPLARAWGRIDRAHFIPEEYRLRAYEAMPLPILEDMTTSQPNVVGHICKAVGPQPGDRVLICGAKSGDLAVVAAELVGRDGRVIVLDSRQDVCDYARARIDGFSDLRGRVEVHCVEDVTLGDEQRGPWDAVVVNGALAKIPQDILTQTSDHGRLLFFMHSLDHGSQRCFVVRKNQDVLQPEALGSFSFTPIYGKWGWDNVERLDAMYREAREARAGRGPAARIDTELPYPLAVSFASAWNAVDAGERHTRTLKAYEALIKYLAIPLVARACETECREQGFTRQLHALAARPSLGHWLAALRDLTRAGFELEGTAALRAALRGALPGNEARRTLDHLHDQLPRMQAYNKPGCLLDLLNAVVAYRNRSGEGHGGARGAVDLEEAADVLLDGLAHVLVHTPWLTGHRLLHLSQLTMARGGVRVRVLDFSGASRPTLVPEQEAAVWYERERAFFEQSMGALVLLEGERMTSLEPWIVWGRGELGSHEDVFFFNGRHGSGEPEYVTGHDTNTYPSADERRAFENLVDAFPCERPKVDLATARQTFEGMLDVFLSDGVIDAKEMASLCVTLVNLGVCDDERVASDYVRRTALERHPGVSFEDD